MYVHTQAVVLLQLSVYVVKIIYCCCSADYLSDEYGYCVDSFKIIDLDSGAWHGSDAWVLEDNGNEMTILVGGHSLEVALEVKERLDSDCPSLYDADIVWTDAEEWSQQQEF